MSNMTIRKVGPDDVDSLNTALQNLAEFLDDPYHASESILAKHLFGPGKICGALLAEIDGRVVGATLYTPLFSTIKGGAGIYVSDLWVDATCRGHGIGPKLLSAAAHAFDGDCQFIKLTVYDDNHAAAETYKKIGFQPQPGEAQIFLEGDAFTKLRGNNESSI